MEGMDIKEGIHISNGRRNLDERLPAWRFITKLRKDNSAAALCPSFCPASF